MEFVTYTNQRNKSATYVPIRDIFIILHYSKGAIWYPLRHTPEAEM